MNDKAASGFHKLSGQELNAHGATLGILPVKGFLAMLLRLCQPANAAGQNALVHENKALKSDTY